MRLTRYELMDFVDLVGLSAEQYIFVMQAKGNEVLRTQLLVLS